VWFQVLSTRPPEPGVKKTADREKQQLSSSGERSAAASMARLSEEGEGTGKREGKWDGWTRGEKTERKPDGHRPDPPGERKKPNKSENQRGVGRGGIARFRVRRGFQGSACVRRLFGGRHQGEYAKGNVKGTGGQEPDLPGEESGKPGGRIPEVRSGGQGNEMGKGG